MTSRVTVDSSVLIAFFQGEEEADDFLPILSESNLIIGAPTALEARIWCLRKARSFNLEQLDRWLSGVEIIPFTGALETVAAIAYSTFGKGLHPAGLNFGDAMAYAVAVHHQAPLLFKGGDFGRTDVPIHPGSVVLT